MRLRSKYPLKRRFRPVIEMLEDRRLLASLSGVVWHDLDADGIHDVAEPGVAGAVVEMVRAVDETIGNADDISLVYQITDHTGAYAFADVNLAPNLHLVVRPPVGMNFTEQNVPGFESVDSDVDAAGTVLISTASEPISLTLDAGLIGAQPEFGFALSFGNPAEGDFQTSDWASNLGFDVAGNIIVSGGFAGAVDFDCGPGVVLRTSAGGRDVYLAKVTPAGALVWVRTIGGAGDDFLRSGGTLDPQGNIHIQGNFNDTVDFDPGPATTLLSAVHEYDGFFARLDPDGNLLWARSLVNDPDPDRWVLPAAAVVDGAGNLYMSGGLEGTVDFDPGPGEHLVTSTGFPYNAFIAKFDSGGDLVWVHVIGEDGWNYANSIKLDSHGALWLTGFYRGTVDFDPGPDVFELPAFGSLDNFVLNMTSDGEFVWAGGFGGTDQDAATDLIFDHSGNIILTGTFRYNADLDPGPGVHAVTGVVTEDIYVVKLDPAGQFVWARVMGGTFRDRPYEVAVDQQNNIHVVGAFYNTVDFDPGPGEFLLTSSGAFDYFLVKLDPSGQFVDARQLGNATTDDFGFDVAVDAHGAIYTVGEFSGTADFDTGPGGFPLTSTGGVDAFMLQILQPTLTGQVWHDADADGIRDPDETLVAGAVAETFASYDGVIGNGDDVSRGAAITDDQGLYALPNLTPGASYYLVVRPPAGHAFTSPDAGGDDSRDSDVNAFGVSDVFSFAGGRTQLSLDAGIRGQAPAFGWAVGVGGSGQDVAQGIATDAAGNVYNAGWFNETVDFDPGPGTFDLSSAGLDEAFVAKYTAEGALVWARAIGGTQGDFALGVAVDAGGGVYLMGAFEGLVDFDPSPSLVPVASAGGSDAFVLKLDAAGNFVYVRTWGGVDDDGPLQVQVDSDGNVITAGLFKETVDFDPGLATFNLTSQGGYDVFMSKLDAVGNFVWARSAGSASDDSARGVAVDALGNVLSTGSFRGTVDFDPGPGVSNLTSESDSRDIFVWKLTSAGDLAFARSMTGAGIHEMGMDVVVDSDGSIVLAGAFEGMADFDPGPATFDLTSAGDHDIFVTKLDAAGNFVWARRLGDTGDDWATGLALDAHGLVYLGGYFQNTVDFDPGDGASLLTSAGGYDGLLTKLDADGNLVFARSLGGAGDDGVWRIALDAEQNVYTSNYFRLTADFDPSPPSLSLTSAGGADVYLLKLHSPPPIVNTTNDSGIGSLREAILIGNANPGPDTIRFAIPYTDAGYSSGTQSWTIQPRSALPIITDTVVLDGSTQPGWAGAPVIALDGSLASTMVAKSALVSHYPMDRSVEDVAGGNEPTETAGISYVPGHVGQGITFQPSGYIDVPQAPNLAPQIFTLSAWVRPDAPGPNDDFHGSAILAKGLSPELGGSFSVSAELTYSHQLKRFLFGFGNFFSDETRILSANTFEAGRFHHVAATYDGQTFRMFVNGQLEGEKALSKEIVYDPAVPWTIGSTPAPYRAVGFPRTWIGVIDEVGIHNRALTADEVERLATPVNGLELRSSSNIVRGLNIQRFSGDGVTIAGDNLPGGGASNNIVGTPKTPNVIAFNNAAGVAVEGNESRGNAIRGNLLYANVGLEIDIGNDGVTANNPSRAGQTHPDLQFAAGGTDTFVVGTILSRPSVTLTIDFFASTQIDIEGRGEGRRYLGSMTVTTNVQGVATIQASLPVQTSLGEFVSATATDAAGNTSEFSRAVPVLMDVHEPNNSQAAATGLGTLSLQTGLFERAGIISPIADRDYFRFEAHSERFAEIQTFAARDGTLLDTTLKLYDAFGHVLASNDDFVGQDSLLRVQLQPGVYYIEVAGFQGSVGPYRMQLFDREFVGPQVLRMTPSTTVVVSPPTLVFLLDDNDLDPTTITLGASRLESVDAAGNSLGDSSSAIQSFEYSADHDRLTLTLGSALSDGRYRVTIKDAITNLAGLALDGDQVGGPGGDFVGFFGVDRTAPEGTIGQTGIAGENAAGILYRFGGSLRDAFPATAGEIVRIELDVDGDGFDDGISRVPLVNVATTPYQLIATTGVAPGQGLRDARVRFMDARGNASAPQTVTLDTDLPVVTRTGSAGATLVVTYNRDGFANIANPASYQVAGHSIAQVVYDAPTRTAVLKLDGGLADGVYLLTVLSGDNGIHDQGLALDGDGDGRAGGNFVAEVLVDRVAPTIHLVRLAAASDSGIAGDARTNVIRPTLEVSVADVFPAATGIVTIAVDVDGDGFDDGFTTASLTGPARTTVAVTVTTPMVGAGEIPLAIRAVDATGNTDDAVLMVTLDRQGPRVLDSSHAELFRDLTGRPAGIRYVLDFDQNLDPSVVANPETFTLFAAGRDRLFYDGDDLARGDKIVSIAYRDASPDFPAPARIEVLVALAADGSDNDDYELTAVGALIVDPAGNSLTGGDHRLRFHFEVLPPIVESAFLLAPFENQLPDRVLVQFRDLFTLASSQGVPLRDGDHLVRFSLTADGQAEVIEIRGMQPDLNPDGPALVQASLGQRGPTTKLTLSWNQPLAAQEAGRGSNYMIVTPGRDRVLDTADDDLIVLRDDAVQPGPDDRQVVVTLPTLAAGTHALRLDGTSDTDLDEVSVLNLANYRLDRLDAAGNAVANIPLTALHYNAFGDRVILSGTDALAAGRYLLQVKSGSGGIANRAAARLDGNDDGQGGDSYARIFDVAAVNDEPTAESLDADALERNHAALEALSYQVQEQMIVGTKALADPILMDRLVEEVQTLTVAVAGTSAEIAASVDDALNRIVTERLDQLPFIPNEFVIVWSHNARFKIDNGREEIGVRLDGKLLDALFAGGTLSVAQGTPMSSAPLIEVALVPIDPLDQLFLSGPAVRVDGLPAFPNLAFNVEMEGLAATNQLGLIYYSAAGLAGTRTFTDIPLETRRAVVEPPDAITGFDPALAIVDRQVLAEVAQIVGPLDRLAQNLLVLWVDPVDFALRNPRGQQVGAIGAQTMRAIPGSYYSRNGYSELLIVPNALGGVYQLSLVGLGLPYRGAVHFEGGTFRASVPFQGALERDAEVAIRMTFTNQAPSPRSPAPPPTDPPQTPPETRTDSQLAVITQMQELARLRNAAASPQSTSRSNAALSAASLSGRQANEGASSTITLAARLSAESPDPPSLPVLEALGVVLQMIRGLLTNIPWLGRILLPTIHVPSALEPMENESIAPSAPALRGEEGSVGQASPLQEPSAPVPTPTAAGTTWWKGLLGLGALLIAMAGHHLEPMAKPGKADRRRLPRGGAD